MKSICVLKYTPTGGSEVKRWYRIQLDPWIFGGQNLDTVRYGVTGKTLVTGTTRPRMWAGSFIIATDEAALTYNEDGTTPGTIAQGTYDDILAAYENTSHQLSFLTPRAASYFTATWQGPFGGRYLDPMANVITVPFQFVQVLT